MLPSPIAFAFSATCAAALPGAGAPVPLRNVLVIVLDDVGPELLGCYDAYFQQIGKPSGSPARTPAIDQLLAAQGLTFTSAWSAPSCTPSRAQILTGRHGFRTGVGRATNPRVLQGREGLQPDQALLPELLHVAPTAYACAAAGKWHLADPGQLALDPSHALGSPPGRWFDRYAGSLFNLRRDPDLPESQTGYFTWQKLWASSLQVGVDPCAGAGLPCEVALSTPPMDGYPTVNTADDAINLIRDLAEPWFAWVSFNAPHAPFHAVPAGLPSSGCGAYSPPAAPCDPGATPTNASLGRCMLEAADLQVGRLLCTVDALDTVVILIGDNGTAKAVSLPPYLDSHGKRTVYEGGVHVPLIVRSPDLAPGLAGTRNDALVSSSDLFATVCELGGVDPALIAVEDSISLVPYLAGQTTSLRATVYAEHFAPNFVPEPGSSLPPPGYVCRRHDQTLRDARFKLLRMSAFDPDAGTTRTWERLFDLAAGGPVDPNTGLPTPDWFEQNDLLGSSAPPLAGDAAQAYAALAGELDALYPSLVR